MSHTVTLDVKLKDHDAVIRALSSLTGYSSLGEGSHRLFDSTRTGLGITLPGWNYPIVIDKEGNVFYDNYGGSWGSIDALNAIKDGYAVAKVAAECDKLSWYYEKQPNGELIIHHPAGGTITVQKSGTLDAAGFSGTSCAEATLPLEQALGSRLGETVKNEMNDVQINQQIRQN